MFDMNDCIFCKIINKEIPAEIIYENEDFLAFVDILPNNFGHSLLLPKKHYENIYTLPNNILTKLGPEIQKLSTAIKKAMKADGINVDMNNDSAAGQKIFHAHFHIIPRFTNDGLKHFKDIKKYQYPKQIEEIAEKITQAL